MYVPGLPHRSIEATCKARSIENTIQDRLKSELTAYQCCSSRLAASHALRGLLLYYGRSKSRPHRGMQVRGYVFGVVCI